MKQIEEMARKIGELYKDPPQDIPKYDLNIAAYLYDAGYRKQADIENCLPLDVHERLKQRAVEREKVEVARKIFEEIEKEIASKIPMKIQPIFKDDRDFEGGFINGKTDALLDVLVLIAELKKKYTEVEK